MSGDATLDRALNRATGARAIAGNRVRLLDAPTALDAMLAAIDAAERRIHFENYMIRADVTGRRFAEALGRAAGRGVTVRILYDWLGCRATPGWYWRDLQAAGCRVRTANAFHPGRPLAVLRRDHRKLVAVDGHVGIVGGVCIADPWTGSNAWRDTAVEVRGPAVQGLLGSFERLWRAAGGHDLDEPPPDQHADGPAAVRIIEGVPGGFRLHRTMEFLAATAGHQLWITDAYFVAPPSLVRALIAAAADGVDVRLMVPGQSDLPVVRTFTRVGYRELLRAGVRIWEWHGPMLHGKTALVDGTRFKVGSSNLNPSSLMGNWELDVLVDDEELGTAAARAFRRDLAQSVEIVLRPPRLAPALPPAVVATARPRPVRAARELPRRAFRTLRQVAGGARRGLAGALTFTLLGLGVLSVTLPTAVAYVLAALAFGFAGLAASRAASRWRD